MTEFKIIFDTLLAKQNVSQIFEIYVLSYVSVNMLHVLQNQKNANKIKYAI